MFYRWLMPFLLAAVLLAGCSSPFKLVVHNELDAPIRVVVEWDDSRPRLKEKPRILTEEYHLAPGEEQKELVWFGEAPATFKVIVTGASTQTRVFETRDYPAALRRSSSMGPTCHLVIADGKWRLTGPTAMDRLEVNLPSLMFGTLCCGLPFLIILIKMLNSGQAKRLGPPKYAKRD